MGRKMTFPEGGRCFPRSKAVDHFTWIWRPSSTLWGGDDGAAGSQCGLSKRRKNRWPPCGQLPTAPGQAGLLGGSPRRSRPAQGDAGAPAHGALRQQFIRRLRMLSKCTTKVMSEEDIVLPPRPNVGYEWTSHFAGVLSSANVPDSRLFLILCHA